MQFRGKQVAAASGAVVAAIALAACLIFIVKLVVATATASSPAAASSSAHRAAPPRRAARSTVPARRSRPTSSRARSPPSSRSTPASPSTTTRSAPAPAAPTCTRTRVLYAGSDSPIPSKEASEVPEGKTVLYFPVQIGPIAIAYNVSGVTGLKLDATVLAGIFSGKITTWNDPAIKALNPSAQPAEQRDQPRGPLGLLRHHRQLLPVPGGRGGQRLDARHRPRSSRSRSPPTPTTAAARSRQAVKATSDSIGYVDFSTATATGLTAASIKNSAGDYVAPSSASAAAAATHVTPEGQPDVPHGRRAGRDLVPDHLPVVGPRVRDSSPTPTTRRCSRPTSATCSGPARACSPR